MVCKVGTDEVYEEAIDIDNAPYFYIEGELISNIQKTSEV
jgi:hypothetical protein